MYVGEIWGHNGTGHLLKEKILGYHFDTSLNRQLAKLLPGFGAIVYQVAQCTISFNNHILLWFSDLTIGASLTK